ncbi:MAG: tyrosine-type recombinase/integrase, partial [Oscillospiraceae bacterium]
EKRAAAHLSLDKLATLSGVSDSTIGAACKCFTISEASAIKIAAALNEKVQDVFTVTRDNTPLGESTIHHYHSFISTVLSCAVDEQLLATNVALALKNPPRQRKPKPQYLDDEQAKQFMACLLDEEDIRVKTALLLLLFTGVRKGELCGLEFPDIQTDKCCIHFQRQSQYIKNKGIVTAKMKTDPSDRTITVPLFVINQLQFYKQWWTEERLKWGAAWEDKSQRVFIQRNGKPISPSTINNWLNSFLDKHGFEHYSVHSLRHTAATLQISNNVDLRTVQARLGWADASTGLRFYSHALISAQERASKTMGDILLPDTFADGS